MKLLLGTVNDGKDCVVANKRLLAPLLSNTLLPQDVFEFGVSAKLKLELQRLSSFAVQMSTALKTT